MTKRTRTILFLICLFLFLLVAPTVVLYSQGYRFDFDSKKITQTGGLFLRVEPKQVEIYLDGKLIEKTDFFFGSALIENLLPKKYKIEMKKVGFLSWEKTLEIKEKEVTEAKNIVLLPENPQFSILVQEVKQFWPSPDQKKIILKEGENDWALKLYDLDKNVKSQLIDENDISPKGVDLLDLSFSEDSKEIFLEVGVTEKVKYFTLNLDKAPPSLVEKKTTDTSSENVVASKKINNDIYYLDKFGYLFKNNEKLNETPFAVKQETEYVLEIFQNFIFLREDKILYQFNTSSKTFEKFFEGINSLEISPDLKKLVYFSDSEIWILFLKEKLDQPSRKAGEKIFLVRFLEKVGDVFWMNSNYLIFNVGDKLKIAEIDDRDGINGYNLVEFNKPKIFFNTIDKKVYILSEGNLYSSENLLK